MNNMIIIPNGFIILEGVSGSTHDLPSVKSQPFVVHNKSKEQPKVYLVVLPTHTLTSS
jgi:hypothetical protein